MDCINLKALHKYRITWDESRQRLERDPWLQRIPGRLGHVYPFGPTSLAVWTDRDRRIRGRLERLGCELWQDGEDEATFIFPLPLLAKVAKVVGLYRRPRLTAAQHKALVRHGKNLQKLKQG